MSGEHLGKLKSRCQPGLLFSSGAWGLLSSLVVGIVYFLVIKDQGPLASSGLRFVHRVPSMFHGMQAHIGSSLGDCLRSSMLARANFSDFFLFLF